jgi:hypothetical protein
MDLLKSPDAFKHFYLKALRFSTRAYLRVYQQAGHFISAN